MAPSDQPTDESTNRPAPSRLLTVTLTGKGGSAKTTSTVSLADALQRATGWRVLVVDLDPQATAGRWVTPGAADADLTLVEVLAGTASLREATHYVRDDLLMVSGHDGLGDLEPDLQGGELANVLRVTDADVVLIDTPGARPLAPGAGLLRMAVDVADLVVVPFGLHETDALVEVIADVENATDRAPGEADLVVLPTRVKPAVAEVVAQVARAVGGPYGFLHHVRRSEAVESIVPTRRLLADRSPRNGAVADYAAAAEQLAQYLAERVGR